MQKNEFLQSLTEQAHLSDEAVKRLAELSCTNQKGTVRHDLTGTILPTAAAFAVIDWLLFTLTRFSDGSGSAMLGRILCFILSTAVLAVIVMHILIWRLDYDGKEETVTLHTLFGGTQTYPMSQVMNFTIIPYTMLRTGRHIDLRDRLVIDLPDRKLVIPFMRSDAFPMLHFSRGYKGAAAFVEYLESRKAFLPNPSEPIPVPEQESPAAPQTEEEEALRREKALRQVELMLVQKQPHTEQRPFYRRHSYYAPPKPRQAVSDNRLDLTELLAQYKLSPEAQERLAKIRAGASKGTVRPHLMTRMGSIAATIAFFVIGMTLENFPYMNVMKPTFLILALLCLVWAYYVHTWKLEYDSESDFVRYHSMFHGTNLYAMQELMLFSVDPVPEKIFPLSFLGMLDPRQYLVIHLPEFVINIPLLFSKEIMGQLIELEGFEGAGDFCRCLRQFEPGTVKQPTAPPQEKRAVKLTKPAEPVPTKKPPPQPVPISEAELPAKPVMPERGSAFPDPTQKPEVDVDALFNQVLREHGKLK